MVVLPWLKDVPKLQALECTVGIQYQSAWLHDDWEIEDCWPSASCVSSAKCCRCEHSIGIEQGSEGLLRSMQSDSLPKLVEGFRLANIRMLNAKCPGTVRANPKCENALIISCRGRADDGQVGSWCPSWSCIWRLLNLLLLLSNRLLCGTCMQFVWSVTRKLLCIASFLVEKQRFAQKMKLNTVSCWNRRCNKPMPTRHCPSNRVFPDDYDLDFLRRCFGSS